MTKLTCDIFGLNAKDIDEAATLVEVALGVRLTPHESSYRSGRYFRGGESEGESFILQKNCDELDGEWNEPEHQDVAYLLYVDDTHRSMDIEQKLTASIRNLKLLRREEL
jgi:hypothetical protein